MSSAITKNELTLYAGDAVLVVAASTSRELIDALRHDFNEISMLFDMTSMKFPGTSATMYVLDFYFLEDPPENHLWMIRGLLVKY